MVSIGAIKRELLRSFFLLFSRCSFQFCFCCGVVMHEKLIKARPTVAPRSRAVFFVRSVDPEIQKTHQPEHDGYDANNTINSSFTWTNGDRLLVIFFFFVLFSALNRTCSTEIHTVTVRIATIGCPNVRLKFQLNFVRKIYELVK